MAFHKMPLQIAIGEKERDKDRRKKQRKERGN
jgi:hypothetical protein